MKPEELVMKLGRAFREASRDCYEVVRAVLDAVEAAPAALQ